MKRSRNIALTVLILTFGFFAAGAAKAQMGIATMQLDTHAILIGNTTHLTLELVAEPGAFVEFPELPNPIVPGLEWLPPIQSDTVQEESGGVRLVQKYEIIGFDTGYYEVPRFPVIMGEETLQTGGARLAVIPVAVDTTRSIEPIRGPAKQPYPWGKLILILGIILILLIGIGIAIWYIIKKIREREVEPEPEREIFAPRDPAHVIALRDLEVLRVSRLWEAGKAKAYHSRLTEIIRAYIEERFQIPALESTTDEIMQAFRDKSLTGSVPFMELKQMLVLADLVKFAKAQPLPAEHVQSLENAIRFVKQTVPPKKVEPKEEEQPE